jgi:hypothetical protein
MNRKSTYQELKQKEINWKSFAISLAIVSFLVISFVELENQQLKSQLNNTEGKNYSCDFVGAIKPEDNRVCEDENVSVPIEVDYHSSEELFCEHYNGKSDGFLFRHYCIFTIEDIKYYCSLEEIEDNKFVFKEPCEAIQ